MIGVCQDTCRDSSRFRKERDEALGAIGVLAAMVKAKDEKTAQMAEEMYAA